MNDLTALREVARAKVNLTLHVTGRRDDGYHLLDSLVVFPEAGDVLSVTGAADISLKIDGPFSDGLETDNNLVMRAARAMCPADRGAALHLTKNLPVAGGIGGGSADAAAALRLLSRFWQVDLPGAGDVASLGADVAVCLASTPQRMSGAGEQLEPWRGLPPFWLVLVNNGTSVATSAVFSALNGQFGGPMPQAIPAFSGPRDLAEFLSRQRNDLEAPACAAFPGIMSVLDALHAVDGSLLARMSGSGGTCFAMFEDETSAHAAQTALRGAFSGWWVLSSPVAQES